MPAGLGSRAVTPARTPTFLAVSALALALVVGCKAHPQATGDYVLEVVEIEQDACGLVAAAGAGPIGTITLSVHGNDVHGELSLPGMGLETGLQGRYHQGLERFLISGDGVRGAACTIPLAQATLEATTSENGMVREEGFSGTLTLGFRAPLEPACACELVAQVQGTLLEGETDAP